MMRNSNNQTSIFEVSTVMEYWKFCSKEERSSVLMIVNETSQSAIYIIYVYKKAVCVVKHLD